MNFTTFFIQLFALALFPLSLAVTLSYDTNYDVASGSLATVACSDGSNGLLSRYPTFGSLPNQYIGAAQVIEGYNSAQCGTCWRLTYKGISINLLAIDHTNDGYNVALKAMNALTNGQAAQLGRIDVTSEQVDAALCGL